MPDVAPPPRHLRGRALRLRPDPFRPRRRLPAKALLQHPRPRRLQPPVLANRRARPLLWAAYRRLRRGARRAEHLRPHQRHPPVRAHAQAHAGHQGPAPEGRPLGARLRASVGAQRQPRGGHTQRRALCPLHAAELRAAPRPLGGARGGRWLRARVPTPAARLLGRRARAGGARDPPSHPPRGEARRSALVHCHRRQRVHLRALRAEHGVRSRRAGADAAAALAERAPQHVLAECPARRRHRWPPWLLYV
mmetsp:Transcript_9870/g.31287  ORF Transcript_9870/g.31287 Transcript_9870/m.31287 type:complete len:250 (-) Transcript_9870:141-890(-)